MSNQKNIQQQLTKIHSEKAQYELNKLRQSFRWRCGNAIARFVEILLFRKPEKLSIDFIEEHLTTINKLNEPNEGAQEKMSWSVKVEHVYFLVSDDDCENSIFGDTHVAADFMARLYKFYNCENKHLVKHDKIKSIPSNSVLIIMLWQTALPQSENKYFSIAWIRNYADKWAENSDFLKYDVFLCSSQKIVDYVKSLTKKPVYLFPIAANTERFYSTELTSNKIVFVGNKWKEERLIDRFLKSTKHKVEAYGKGRANKTIKNSKIPNLYRESKIIIDSANETTQKWQSLNSRVFNAIAAQRLVLTNSIEAAKLFKNELPIYKDEADLEQQISFYLNNKKAYEQKVTALYRELLFKHDYFHRSAELEYILSPKIKIAIKIAASEANKKQFGDLYFAKSLAKNFAYYGHKVRIDCVENWTNTAAVNDDLVIVLRGLRAYQPLKEQTNFMWLISHPEDVTVKEIVQYKHCFIASEFHCDKLKEQGVSSISFLPQCSDVDLFHPIKNGEPKEEALLFVGNSRNIYRKSVKYAIELGIPIHVYGGGWKQFIPTKHIKAAFVANDKLNELYNRYQIVLNDHWDDMLDYGYANNRMFDVLASSAILLSDRPKKVENLLSGLVYYSDKASFKTKVHQIKDSKNLNNKGNLQSYYNHNFKKRAQHILQQYYTINEKVV